MPKKAIETECMDFVLTARGIAEKISEIAQHPYLIVKALSRIWDQLRTRIALGKSFGSCGLKLT
jgi:hypothetical protein